MQSIYSFSIKKSDTKGLNTVKEVKELCDSKGLSFSHVIVEALKEYKHNLEPKK